MPIEKTEAQQGHFIGIWHIQEGEDELSGFLNEKAPPEIIHAQKRLEWLAVRALTKKLVEDSGLAYKGIIKDQHGKPFLIDNPSALSLTHSYPYVAALIVPHGPAGIDLEQPRDKILMIAPRVLDEGERNDAGLDVTKHCVYWCAKETLLKIHGKKDLTFSSDLNIAPFSLHQEGNLIGTIFTEGKGVNIPMKYHIHDRYVLVYNTASTYS